MLYTRERDTGIIVAEGTNGRQLAKILAGIAGISSEDCVISVVGSDHPVYPEAVFVYTTTNIRRAQREPLPSDASFSVSRIHDLYSTPYTAKWYPTCSYLIKVGPGVDLEVFRDTDGVIKQATVSQRPFRRKIGEGLRNLLSKVPH